MDKIFIGIDPGSNGGIAWHKTHDNSNEVVKMPQTLKDIYDTLLDLHDTALANKWGIICYIEDVGRGMPGQSSVATAKFARHVGNLEMALTAAKIPFTFVTPGKWMKGLSLGTAKEYPTHTAWKNHLKERAQQQFPDFKITLWSADALLILQFCKLKEK